MPSTLPYTFIIDRSLNTAEPEEGLYLVIVHAKRIPPHIGMIIGKHYYSLSIKGQELDVPVEAFVRNTMLRKIPSLLIRIAAHPLKSDTELKALMTQFIRRFPKVEIGKATCLSPVKLFFEAAYGTDVQDVNYVFELLPKLEEGALIGTVTSLCIDEKTLQLPLYSLNDIHAGIAKAEQEAKEITRATKN